MTVEDFVKGGLAVVAILSAFVLFLWGLGAVITLFDRGVDDGQCTRFGQASGYEVQWADYTFWSYECLAKTESGKWIPTDQLREVNR